VSGFSRAGARGLQVDGLADPAADLGLRAVFAVTVSEDASAFFARKGFAEVDHAAVPAVKWSSYDAARKARARVFWRDVGAA
jgi:amino-acid N-acetyltransferase